MEALPEVLETVHHDAPEFLVKAHMPEDVTVTDSVSASPENLSSVGVTDRSPSICFWQPAARRAAAAMKT